jgi:hypothetical protein
MILFHFTIMKRIHSCILLGQKYVTGRFRFPFGLDQVPPAAAAETGELKRSSRLASKESQLYEPVEVRAIKLRGLKDALGGCTSTLQRQVKKHGVLNRRAKPLGKRAVKAITASLCASDPMTTGSDV